MAPKARRYYDATSDSRALLQQGALNWSGLLPGAEYRTLAFIRAEPRSIAQGAVVLFCKADFVRDDQGGFSTYTFLQNGEQRTVSRTIDETKFSRETAGDGVGQAAQKSVEALYSVSPAQRVIAAWALAESGGSALIPALWRIALWDERTLLQEPSGHSTTVRREVREALVLFGPALVAFISEQKNTLEGSERRLARELASRCGSLLFWEEIVLDAKDPKPSSRKRAAEELAPLTSPEAKALLAVLANDPNADVRITATLVAKA